MASERKITDLPDLISDLSPEDRALANRIFDVSATTGRLDPPEAMHAWIEKSFGSVDNVTAQRIVKVTDLVTVEGTLFNELRASRPFDTGVGLDLDREIAATEGDPFCHPKEGTPADVFGRVEGEHAITASNVAKYDGFHGVIVFDDHNPLHLTPEKVSGGQAAPSYTATHRSPQPEVPITRRSNASAETPRPTNENTAPTTSKISPMSTLLSAWILR